MKKVMSEEEKMRNRDLMHEILDIVLDTNGFESRKRSETGTLPTLFLSFSGHVSGVSIDLHEDGWEPGGHKSGFNFYIDSPIDKTAVENLRTACRIALTEKTAYEVLERDIEAQETKVFEERKKLSRMRKRFKMMTREEEGK